MWNHNLYLIKAPFPREVSRRGLAKRVDHGSDLIVILMNRYVGLRDWLNADHKATPVVIDEGSLRTPFKTHRALATRIFR